MSEFDKRDRVAASIERALKATAEAQAALEAAEPFGKTARVLNPLNRLGQGLAEAQEALQGCRDEYRTLLEAVGTTRVALNRKETMTAKTYFLPNTDGSQTVMLGSSSEPKSMLDDLTPEETAAMMAWSEQQPRSPGGSIDLMGWPGWEGVVARRFKDRFGVDLPKSAS